MVTIRHKTNSMMLVCKFLWMVLSSMGCGFYGCKKAFRRASASALAFSRVVVYDYRIEFGGECQFVFRPCDAVVYDFRRVGAPAFQSAAKLFHRGRLDEHT